MSLTSPLHSKRVAAVAAAFDASAPSYEAHAGVQRDVAARLARLLPELTRPRVLELGCGTGLFSRHLVESYPDGRFVLTDAAPAMLAECRHNLAPALCSDIAFEIMDAGRPGEQGPFDLIASSMALHWVVEPTSSLEQLRALLAPGGTLLYSALGPESFTEWRAVLEAEGLPSGLADLPQLPGTIHEERLTPDASALAFLTRIKAVGGLTPRDGYRPLAPGALRRAIRAADMKHGGRITWHIVYGRMASSPSTSPA
jgi:malonyl-CoA O-methyltransferase